MQDDNKKLQDSKSSEEADSLIKQQQKDAKQQEISPNKRQSKDLSNGPNGDRRSSYLENGNGPPKLDQIPEIQKQDDDDEEEKQTKKTSNLAILLNSRIADYVIIILVIVYTCLVFINFAFTNEDAENNKDIEFTLYIVLIIELVILFIFIFEIALKSYAFGIKNYFQDYWLIFDALVIVISVVMIFLDWTLEDASFKTVSKVLRGIFRFLRLFLVFRKFNTVKKISQSNTRYSVRAPIEKILEILNNLTTEFEDQKIVKELKWSIDKISSNKLYEALIDEQGKNQKDAKGWIESMNQQKKEIKQEKEKELEIENDQIVTQNESNVKVYKLNIPQPVFDSLKSDVCNLEYDYFSLYDQHGPLILPYLVCFLFDTYNIYQQLKIDPKIAHNLVEKIGKGQFNLFLIIDQVIIQKIFITMQYMHSMLLMYNINQLNFINKDCQFFYEYSLVQRSWKLKAT